jgi:glycerophosphoryl diester phosphodiesterase
MNGASFAWPRRTKTPLAISHQGIAADDAPACSLAAFTAAYLRGCRYLETDVRATSDDVVALHDVDAKVGGRGLHELSRAELETALGRRLASLAELLDAFDDVCWNFEVKSQRDADALLHALHMRTNDLLRVSISWGPTLRVASRARRHAPAGLVTAASVPEILRCWLASLVPFRSSGSGPSRARPYQFAQYHHLFLRKRLVSALHRDDVGVHAWGVTSLKTAARLAALDVDGVITDSPAVLERFLGSDSGG